MTEELLAEVKIQFTKKSYQMFAITHKDGQSVEVEIAGLDWVPGERWLHFEDLKITLVQSSCQKVNEND